MKEPSHLERGKPEAAQLTQASREVQEVVQVWVDSCVQSYGQGVIERECPQTIWLLEQECRLLGGGGAVMLPIGAPNQ